MGLWECSTTMHHNGHMTEHVIDVDGMTLSVVDVLDTESKETNVSSIRPARRAGNGRQAFAEGFCEIHGPSEDGAPCAKFSHLPGNGVGAYKPSILRRARSFFVSLIKPMVLIGFVAGSLYLGSHFLPNLFSLGNFVPGTNVVPNGGTNTNGNSDRHNDGNRNSPTDGTKRNRSTNGSKSGSSHSMGSSLRSDASAINLGSRWIEVRV